MYARRIRGSVYHSSKLGPFCQDKALYRSINHSSSIIGNISSHSTPLRGQFLCLLSSWSIAHGNRNIDLCARSGAVLNGSQFRLYSSEGDGRNTSEDSKHAPVGNNFDVKKNRGSLAGEDSRYCDAHAHLAEQDQLEWLNNERLAIESKMKESPFLSRREKFKNEFFRRIIPWERIHLSWKTFPYYINEHAKDILVECVASHLKNKEVTDSYGARLASSSGRILLQSMPGTELYPERIVKALARELRVPLLILDSSVLAPYVFSDASECESDEST